jgi:hypothetical protein
MTWNLMDELQQIVLQLEAERKALRKQIVRITAAIHALKGTKKTGQFRPAGIGLTRVRGAMPLSTRKRISETQKLRWQEAKRKKKPPPDRQTGQTKARG